MVAVTTVLTALDPQEYLRLWRPDLVDREMFRLVTIAGGLNNQLPSGAGLFPVSAALFFPSTLVAVTKYYLYDRLLQYRPP